MLRRNFLLHCESVQNHHRAGSSIERRISAWYSRSVDCEGDEVPRLLDILPRRDPLSKPISLNFVTSRFRTAHLTHLQQRARHPLFLINI